MNRIEELLADHPDFYAFDDLERMKLAQHARVERFPAGSTIFQEEDEAEDLVLLLSGEVAVQNTLPGREPIQIETLSGGDILGWAWLMPPFRRMSDAIALNDVEAVALDAAGVRTLCNAHPELGYRLYQRWLPHLADRFRAQRLQLLSALSGA
ncbi:cyclic nucleotide-binding domain-containing protein [Tropicimonas sp. TH_r6]|uniref:cyclic nucleotide-binding domain-containing protein n=1 Tax=Tropicimonas sp. TH_r6 TaxID=3082085 RepID=UPI002955558E|nr:cyclic nucleotide-binding domain-containing protein [Tropicimonas sp. TH_r6]MDV7144409.1 cyclic nucleotide-binding domain-containing protein [Tropicimonas sp. TH_r6]